MTEPFNYQLQCIEAMRSHTKFANFSSMGSGKTLVTLYTYKYLRSSNKNLKLVVVCPKSLKREWVSQISEHCSEYNNDIQIIASGDDHLNPKKHIYIINYDILKPRKLKGKKRVGKFTDVVNKIYSILPNAVLVSDECQRIGHYKSNRTKVFEELSREAKFVYLMTGTPMLNKPETLFPILRILGDVDASCWSFYMAYQKFIDEYCIKDPSKFNAIVGYKNLDKLNSRLNNLSIRFKLEDVVDLPPVMHNTHYAELSGDQLKLYTSMKENLIAYINTLTQKQLAKEASNILVQMMRLMQICSDPALLGHISTQLPAKLSVLDDLIEDNIQESKIIISTVFRDMNETIARRYAKYNPVQLRGGMTEAQIEKVKEEFINGNSRILVIHPAVGGIGLNLTCSNMIIFYDRNFSLTEWLQAQARIHRIGQNRACSVVKIVAENTIDEKIDSALKLKEVLADKVLSSSTEIQSFKNTVINLLSEGNENKMKFDFGSQESSKPSYNPGARMDQLNSQLKEQASIAMLDLSTDKLNMDVDDVDADLIRGLLGGPPTISTPNSSVPAATNPSFVDIPIVKVNPVALAASSSVTLDTILTAVNNGVHRIEFNLTNKIALSDEDIKGILKDRIVSGMVLTAEKILELEQKIDMLIVAVETLTNEPKPAAEVVKRTRTRKPTSIPVDGDAPFDTTTNDSSTKKDNSLEQHNRQQAITQAARIVDSVLKKNGFAPPWNIEDPRTLQFIKTILINKNLAHTEDVIMSIAKVLASNF